MDVVFFVCLRLDHYLHQHGRCGPTGATWLGGVATYTTTMDQCTKMIFFPSSTFAWISCLDDVSLFDAFPYYDV